MDTTPKPWERQPYETQAAFTRFTLYLEQDSPRFINAAYRSHRAKKGLKEARVKAPGSWRNMAAGKDQRGAPIPGALTWEERANAWDDYLLDQERLKWVERRLQLKEKEWDVSQALLEKAQQMLMFPVIETRSEDGGRVTVIMPAGWNFRDLPAIAGAASKLARLAAEMSTENVTVDWREEARKAGIDDPDEVFREAVTGFERKLARENATGGISDRPSEPGTND